MTRGISSALPYYFWVGGTQMKMMRRCRSSEMEVGKARKGKSRVERKKLSAQQNGLSSAGWAEWIAQKKRSAEALTVFGEFGARWGWMDGML